MMYHAGSTWPIQEAYVEKNHGRDAIDIYLTAYTTPMDKAIYLPLSAPCFNTVTPGMVSCGPALSLDRDSAQTLFDALYDAGLRPSKPKKEAQSPDAAMLKLVLESHHQHLNDLRRMAFGSEGIVSLDTRILAELEPTDPDRPRSAKGDF